MIYPLELRQAGLLAGLLLVGIHALALARPRWVAGWLKAFPRSRGAGLVLIAAAGLWSLLLLQQLDLGEFSSLRTLLLAGTVAATVLSAIFMVEFLAVRALGMLLLLAAEPFLEAAFLRPEVSRLLLVVLAYAWIFAGLFWVGMPYLLRDQLSWILACPRRLVIAASLGVAYGVAILVCSLTFW